MFYGAGIICYKLDNGEYKFLLVNKSYSESFRNCLVGKNFDPEYLNLFELYMFYKYDFKDIYMSFFDKKDITEQEILYIERIKKKNEIILSKESLMSYITLHKYNDNIWDIPKGHVTFFDGSNEETALREFEEETRISRKNILIDENFHCRFINRNYPDDDYKIKYYIAKYIGPDTEDVNKSSDEIMYSKWMSIYEIRNISINHNQKSLIESIFNELL